MKQKSGDLNYLDYYFNTSLSKPEKLQSISTHKEIITTGSQENVHN